jgi:hypothetical protein
MMPQNTRIARMVPIEARNTMPPPSTNACRRSPRLQAVIAASAAKITSNRRLNWPTSIHGFDTPSATETDSLRNGIHRSAVRKN